MREILFRGKRVDNGEWVYGALFSHNPEMACFENDKKPTKALIINDGFCDWGFEPPICCTEVIPSTVGQYTGLTDKNGKRIFEGDIIRAWGFPKDTLTIQVMWYDKHAGFNLMGLNTEAFEIIGNIYDNPELIKERECGELQKG